MVRDRPRRRWVALTIDVSMFSSISTRRGTERCWTYLECQDPLILIRDRHNVAIRSLCLPSEPLKEGCGICDFSLGFNKRLPVFQTQNQRQVVDVLPESTQQHQSVLTCSFAAPNHHDKASFRTKGQSTHMHNSYHFLIHLALVLAVVFL